MKKCKKIKAHILFDGTLTLGKRIICGKNTIDKAAKQLEKDGFDGIMEVHRDNFKCTERRIKPFRGPTNG